MDSLRGTPEFSWTDVCARRLERHWLAAPAEHGRPADIVRAMCGAHAQVFTAAELSIGIRALGLSQADVRQALWEERSLVKTYGPRGTVHLLPAEDLSLWTGALGAVPPFGEVRRRFVSSEQTDEIVTAIADALRTAELTVDELSDAIVERTGPWAGELVMPAFSGMWPRWRAAIADAAFRGALCFGRERGRKVTYSSPASFLPEFQPVEAKTALAWLVRAYLFAYGPATPAHFAQWLSADRQWAAALFDSLSAELLPVALDDGPGWVVGGDSQKASTDPAGIRLLPYFDAYVVGCQPRELLFPGEAATRALSRGQAGNFPVVLVDGVAGGLWHQRRSGRRIEVTAEVLRPLTRSQKDELRTQVERIGGFLDSEPTLTLGTVRAGAHA